jgi:tetraspanin-18
MHFSGVNELATGFEEILQPDAFEQISYILIAAGGTVSVVSFLGCWGASSESKNILICYGALLALILLLEITAGGMVAASTRPISGSIKDSLKSSLTDHYVGADKNALTVLWDYTMANIKCCGVNSHEDFKDAKKFAQANKKVPEACCILQGDLAKLQPKNKTCTQEPTDSNSYWKNGCFVALMQRVWIHKLMAVGIGVGLALLQLLGVIFAFYFSGYILNDDNFSSDGEEGERGLYS